jgi:hypothetical protein
MFDAVPEVVEWDFDPETFLCYDEFVLSDENEPNLVRTPPLAQNATIGSTIVMANYTPGDLPLSVEGSFAELLGLEPADLPRPSNPINTHLEAEEDPLVQISASTLQGLILLVDQLKAQ